MGEELELDKPGSANSPQCKLFNELNYFYFGLG